jgi:deoxyribodipyrimidine photo-lyase
MALGYGFANRENLWFFKIQVKKRASKLCNECELINNCPIENWPEVSSITNKDINIDLNIEKNFGPQSIQTSKDQPDYVWINGESLGDDDPALAKLPELPVIFIFDATLLKSLNLSTKRIIFLLEILKEISHKREIKVYLDNPVDILSNKKFASTFAPVPKYKKITNKVKPTIEFPAKRLAEPINFYPRSFSSWRKKTKIIS